MALSQVGTATSGIVAATTAFSPTLSTGWVPGDVGYVAVSANLGSGPTATGWTLVDSNFDGATNWLGLFRRVLLIGDTAPSFTSTGGAKVWGCLVLRGVNALLPEDGHTSNTNTITAATIIAASVTTTVANDYLITCFGNRLTRTGTAPGGSTELVDLTNTVGLQINLDTLGALGVTGTRTETLSGNGGSELSITCAVRVGLYVPRPLTSVSQAVNRSGGF